MPIFAFFSVFSSAKKFLKGAFFFLLKRNLRRNKVLQNKFLFGLLDKTLRT